jgi:hypothetical protein
VSGATPTSARAPRLLTLRRSRIIMSAACASLLGRCAVRTALTQRVFVAASTRGALPASCAASNRARYSTRGGAVSRRYDKPPPQPASHSNDTHVSIGGTLAASSPPPRRPPSLTDRVTVDALLPAPGPDTPRTQADFERGQKRARWTDRTRVGHHAYVPQPSRLLRGHDRQSGRRGGAVMGGK